MATGRIVSRELRIPRANVSPRFIVTPREWWITDQYGNGFYAHGAVRNVVGAFATAEGLTIALSGTKSVRFVMSRAYADRAKALVEVVLAHARLCTSGFANLAPGQRPLMLVGTYVGGRGSELKPGEECVVAVSGSGICATGLGSVLLKPADGLRAVELGGVGAYRLSAGLMNKLAERRHLDCLVRFVFDDAQATFGLAGDTPQQLQVDASALIAVSRGASAAPSANAEVFDVAAAAQRAPASEVGGEPVNRAVRNFCGFCGARRISPHKYCAGCGNPYDS